MEVRVALVGGDPQPLTIDAGWAAADVKRAALALLVGPAGAEEEWELEVDGEGGVEDADSAGGWRCGAGVVLARRAKYVARAKLAERGLEVTAAAVCRAIDASRDGGDEAAAEYVELAVVAEVLAGERIGDILRVAAGGGNVALLRSWASLGVDMNTPGTDGMTAAHSATVHGRAAALSVLHDLGADMARVCASGYSPLALAARGAGIAPADTRDALKFLLAAGVPLVPASPDAHHPMALAAGCSLAGCEALLAAGADAAGPDTAPYASVALKNRRADIACALFDAGASVEAASDGEAYRVTLLMHACGADASGAACRELLARGAAVDRRTSDGSTALIHAAGTGRSAACGVLLDAGADVNARCDRGRTALHAAADRACAEVLLARGADPEARCDERTPLLARCVNYNPEDRGVLEALLEHGADPNAVDATGRCALTALLDHRAPPRRVIAALLHAGADPRAGDVVAFLRSQEGRLSRQQRVVVETMLDVAEEGAGTG